MTLIRRVCITVVVTCAVLCMARSAHANPHPSIPATIEDLNILKAGLNQEPWKSGYAMLQADGHSSLNYTMQGPFATVSRAPNVNLGQWRNDMTAVFNLSRMWYFTGNTAYAQKARDILIAWANTQTSFGGNEAGLDLGDYAFRFAGGADILRGTWAGWTDADTTAVQNYFLSVFWPRCFLDGGTAGPANKGSLYMAAAIAIAVFCDDTEKFNFVVNLYRTYPGSGLRNTLATGEMGETGRDEGHGYGDLLGHAFLSEVAWKQGVDLYSEWDNRLLAGGEYYARNTLMPDNPFVPFGTVDYNYYVNAQGPYLANRAGLYLIQNAYKNRRNLPTPWIDRKIAQQPVDADNWMYAKTADSTTATPLAPIAFPAVSLASSGLTLATLGTQTAGRSVGYADGVWTLAGLGNGAWSDTADDAQFAYQTVTGDGAIVAQITSNQYVSSNAVAGLMIRDNLSATVSQRGWIGIVAASPNLVQSYVSGWTSNWGGSNWAKRSQPLPPGMPYWLKIERLGNLITTFTSQDGTNWAATNSASYANLPSTLYMGLFICSGATTTNTATFANVAFTGGSGGLVTAPAAPAALLATGSSKAITLRWLPSFGATAYDLFRSTTSGTGYAVIAGNLSTSHTSYVDKTVTAGTTYYYVVQARNWAGASGNSPEFGDSLPGAPMVNLAFGGTPSANLTSSSTEGPDKAFDRNPGSKWYAYSAPTGWIQYDFGAGNEQLVKRYTVTSATDAPARDPVSWNFLGSQDGVSWDTLDSQSDQSFANRCQENSYDISNTTLYRFYLLQITANNGATGVALSELGLWSDTGRTIPDGRYRLVNRRSNKVIDVSGGSTANGAPLVQMGYNGADSQKWDLAGLGSGQYSFTAVASGNVIDVSGASTANGAHLIIWPYSGANNQRWIVTPAGDGYYMLLAVHSGKVADVASGSTADGAKIIQWPYLAGDNQQWSLSLVP